MALVQHKQIKTTLVKAKVARSLVEKMITAAKQDTVAARRHAFKWLQNHQLVKKLFEEIAPTFAERNGGYTRVIKLGRRQGDGAELAILQLVGFEPVVVEKTAEKKKRKKAAPEKKEAAVEKAAEEKVEEKAEEVKEKAAEKKPKKEAKPKEEKEKKPLAKEEKHKEKAKATPKKAEHHEKAEQHEKAEPKKKSEKPKSDEHKKAK
jgi:large subunit ribosomal protein L17